VRARGRQLQQTTDELRDGMNAHLDPDVLPAEPRPAGRVARRKAAYYAAIANASDYRARLARVRAGRRHRPPTAPWRRWGAELR
jgi:hypothetical protein